jgi:two-component system, NtrC family, sensor kinase
LICVAPTNPVVIGRFDAGRARREGTEVKDKKLHRILVIDDNPEIHQDFRKILCLNRSRASKLEAMEAELFEETGFLGKQLRFEVDSAFQGTEGLARVHHALQEGRPYEMAFVDVRMPPGLDGIEVTPMLWKADPTLQIIICTAYSDYSWEEMFAKVGASDRMFFLQKPFDRAEVLQLSHALVEKRRVERMQSGLQVRAKTLEKMSERLQSEIDRLRQDNQQPG